MSAPAETGVSQDVNIDGRDHKVNIAGGDVNIIYILSLSLFRWVGGFAVAAAVLGVLIPLATSDAPSVRTSPPFHQTFGTLSGATAIGQIAAVPRVGEAKQNARATRHDIGERPSPPAPAQPAISQVSFETPARPILSEPAEWPQGKSALCRDGSFSASQHRPGTCANHDGVAFWRYPAGHPYWSRGNEA